MNFPEVVLLVCTTALFLAGLVRKAAPALTAGLGVMAGSLAILIAAPLGLFPMSLESTVVVLVGVIAVSAPIWLPFHGTEAQLPVAQASRNVALARLVLISALVLVATIVGFRAFMDSIEAATGTGFSNLTLVQIRAAQNGAARGGGILALLGSLSSLLGCLGIYGALRFSRVWLALPALSIVLALQNPSRLNSISLLVVLLVFYIYLRTSVLRKGSTSDRPRRSRRLRLALLVVAGLVCAVLVFNAVGSELGKNNAAAALMPNYTWPSWTLSPFYYFAGGFPAFSQALQGGSSPFDPGSSFFSALRILSFFGGNEPPNTIADYVSIPGLFNLYTAPGQLYFDSGVFGLVTVLLGLGILVAFSHRKAAAGYVEWVWVSAVLFTVLVSFPQSFILFHLDLDFELLVGFFAFRLLRTAKKTIRSELSAPMRRGISS